MGRKGRIVVFEMPSARVRRGAARVLSEPVGQRHILMKHSVKKSAGVLTSELAQQLARLPADDDDLPSAVNSQPMSLFVRGARFCASDGVEPMRDDMRARAVFAERLADEVLAESRRLESRELAEACVAFEEVELRRERECATAGAGVSAFGGGVYCRRGGATVVLGCASSCAEAAVTALMRLSLLATAIVHATRVVAL